ncbi:MAG: phosphoadenylyl-sulfate reductase [Bacteroidales bacterium]|nr:phosphoadenylyl-sulfate reductase [Bacteroidales bacterium]
MDIEALNKRFENASVTEVLTHFLSEYKGEIGLSSSLSYEDQVLTHLICQIDKTAKIFTLDTGRFFPETYTLIDKTNLRYGIKLQVYFPDYQNVQKMVNEHGINLFYDSIENRHLCCQIRKIEPLKRALHGLKVWITGLRRSQSVTRKDMQLVEYDADDNIIKLNPLINWSEEDVIRFVKANNVPYNKLHDKGFPSIGCQPCTRAVEPGEDIRSGRWWWENPEHRECGLHRR